MRSRWLSVVATILTVLTMVGLAASPAHAAPSQPLTGTVKHDLSHPEKENYPCAGMAHSGMSPIGQEPQFNCTQHGGNGGPPSPYAGDQHGNCTNGVTYLQGFQNPPGFPNQKIYVFHAASPYSTSDWDLEGNYVTANVNAFVKYYWCPSSHFASGSINYSNTYIAPQNSTCIDTSTGGFGGDGSVDHGADMHMGSSYVGDGESQTLWTNICQGNYIWDYSSLGDGQYSWVADLFTIDTGSSIASVQTPWAQ